MEQETSLVLTGVYSGMRLASVGAAGLVAATAKASAQSGYGIATKETTEGVSFTVLSVSSVKDADDPANLEVSAHYQQQVAISELDLDIRYTDIPADTQIQLEATKAGFSISRQAICGSALVGSKGTGLEDFDMDLKLRLWVSNPDKLTATSALVLSLSKILTGNSGPVKKVLLQKIQINLSH